MMRWLLFFGLAFVCQGSSGQALRIGSTIPDEVYQNVINYSRDSLRLVEFKKKLVILDFWGTGCAACIYAFEELERLQQRFAGDLQIVMVNKESRDSTERFFAKRKKIKKPAVPFLTNDKKLHQYFPYSGYPYQVWIDEAGKIIFKTESYNATPENISQFLAGEKMELDSITATVFSGPVLKSGNQEWIDDLNYYSLISKCRPGLNVGYASGLREGEKVLLNSNCSSIAELFRKAVEARGRYEFRVASKIVIEDKDKYRYLRPDDANLRDQWEREYSYNYELSLPLPKKNELYRYMEEDLERYFNIEARVEKRMVMSHVFVRTSNLDRLKSRGGIREDKLKLNSNYFPIEDSVRYLKNTSFGVLAMKLKAWVEHATQLPFTDETGYKGAVDFAIQGDAYDSFNLELLRKELKKYDLDIISKEVMMDVLVLRPVRQDKDKQRE